MNIFPLNSGWCEGTGTTPGSRNFNDCDGADILGRGRRARWWWNNRILCGTCKRKLEKKGTR